MTRVSTSFVRTVTQASFQRSDELTGVMVQGLEARLAQCPELTVSLSADGQIL